MGQGQGHRHQPQDLLEAATTPPGTPVTASAVPVRLSGIIGVFGDIVNGVYAPTEATSCLMPIYKKVMNHPHTTDPSSPSGRSKLVQTFLVFDDSFGPRSRAAWLVRTASGKIYARAVLPSGAPRCFPQELYMSADGKYRRSDVVWEMKSSVTMFGFRVRPAGAVHVVDGDRVESTPQAAESMLTSVTVSSLVPAVLRESHDLSEDRPASRDEVHTHRYVTLHLCAQNFCVLWYF